MSDTVLPSTIFTTMSEAYLGSGGDPLRDMFLSPIIAPPHLLAQYVVKVTIFLSFCFAESI
jgi:hypothetical protein